MKKEKKQKKTTHMTKQKENLRTLKINLKKTEKRKRIFSKIMSDISKSLHKNLI